MFVFFIIAVMGAPQVLLFTKPDKNSGSSGSLRGVAQGELPGARRCKKIFNASKSISSPAGMPSRVIPIAVPWDCPKMERERLLFHVLDIVTSPLLFCLESLNLPKNLGRICLRLARL